MSRIIYNQRSTLLFWTQNEYKFSCSVLFFYNGWTFESNRIEMKRILLSHRERENETTTNAFCVTNGYYCLHFTRRETKTNRQTQANIYKEANEERTCCEDYWVSVKGRNHAPKVYTIYTAQTTQYRQSTMTTTTTTMNKNGEKQLQSTISRIDTDATTISTDIENREQRRRQKIYSNHIFQSIWYNYSYSLYSDRLLLYRV